ncbi:16S ribosomal RNA methyltransferase RsmE [Galbibacter marinus]|uniref:Ribosomal RNA small subunit methyltransferase E n=1 Tax=Galbibacter marinus TaxID=555500 RepID=K2QJP0_9FLAO|nr:16S rRNA (uracil(1498)-N(3))-methyltransferase [Galbibacter marinus]EKF54927.1 16S ribosomal RNA methyltransferase RsmE [Galbibacter marinus]
MQLFYAPDLVETSKEYQFDKEESRHIHKVLRKTIGDSLHITNGKGWIFEAKILASDAKQCSVQLLSSTFKNPRRYRLHMAVAPTKMNDRFEWFLEKATEIGIDEITPIICDHSERKVVKLERYEKIIQSAAKQSLNPYLPVLHPPQSFSDLIGSVSKQAVNEQLFIAHCEDQQKQTLQQAIEKQQSALILIGPEGDFSPSEIITALANDFKAVSLGDSRLRTETAAIVACHTFALVNQI